MAAAAIPYVYPQLGRAGLGNCLFPWARAVLFAREHGCRMIAPFWARPRIGPWLRRESDKRLYGRLFTNACYIRGAKRLWLLWRTPKVHCSPDAWDFDYFTDRLKARLRSATEAICVFRGMSNMFLPLRGQHETILHEFVSILKPQYVPAPDAVPSKFIAVNVRMGDFLPPDADPPRKNIPSCRRDPLSPALDREAFLRVRHGLRLPVESYLDMLREVRKRLGQDTVTLVFSDGRDDELRPLLSEKGVALYRGGSAVSDLLCMTRASLLIGSNSTFSEWASFLGQVPSIYSLGGVDGDLFVDDAKGGTRNLACECDSPDRIPGYLLDAVERALR